MLCLLISICTSASVNISHSVKRQLTEATIKDRIHTKLNTIDSAAVSTAAVTASACTQLGEVALIDIEPVTKTSAFAADGVCWLIFGSIQLSSYFIAEINSTTNRQSATIKVEKVSPHIYDDGVIRITSVAVGDSYQITLSRPFFHNTYMIKPTNRYFSYAKTLEQHRSRSQEQLAFKKIKEFIKDENRRITEGFCFEPDSSKKRRRQATIYVVNYCLPRLSSLPNGIHQLNLSITLNPNVLNFQINELQDSASIPWGAYGVQINEGRANQSNYNYNYSQLHVLGLLFSSQLNGILMPGSPIDLNHRYEILNLLNISRNHLLVGHQPLINTYLTLFTIDDLFEEELDNIDIYPLDTDENIAFYYQSIRYITNFISVSPDWAEDNYDAILKIVDHYTNWYLDANTESLSRRQLIILNSISLILASMSNSPINLPVKGIADRFMHNLWLTRPIGDNYNSPITIFDPLTGSQKNISTNGDLRQFTIDILKEISQ